MTPPPPHHTVTFPIHHTSDVDTVLFACIHNVTMLYSTEGFLPANANTSNILGHVFERKNQVPLYFNCEFDYSLQ